MTGARLMIPAAKAGPLPAARALTARRPRLCWPRWASPAPTSTAPSPSWSAPRASAVRTIVGINHDAVFGSHARGLAPRPARRLQGALRPAALAQGPRAARPRAPGQHRPVPPGRHAAGLIGPDPHALRRRGRAPGGDLFEAPAIAFQHRAARRSTPASAGRSRHSTSGRAPAAAPAARSSRRQSGSSPTRRTGRGRCPATCSSSGSPARPAPPASSSDADHSGPACR